MNGYTHLCFLFKQEIIKATQCQYLLRSTAQQTRNGQKYLVAEEEEEEGA